MREYGIKQNLEHLFYYYFIFTDIIRIFNEVLIRVIIPTRFVFDKQQELFQYFLKAIDKTFFGGIFLSMGLYLH